MLQKNNTGGLEYCFAYYIQSEEQKSESFKYILFEDDGKIKKVPAEKKEEDYISSRMSTKKKHRKKETIGWIISLATAVVLALLLRFFVFEFIRVDGPSMESTLWSDEIVMVEKVSYHFSPPERFNIIICYSPDNVTLVKRVIGLPGDKLEIKNFKLYINDKEIQENYLSEPMDKDMAPVIVPEKHVFVMGDHRNVSQDSRSESVGHIPYDKILGRGVFIVWPFNKMTALSNK